VKKVCPVPASLLEHFCCICCIPKDLLLSLSSLPCSPPEFTPSIHLTQEQLKALQLNTHNFLHLEELKLLQHVLKINEAGLAWMEDEKGHFRDQYFLLVKIPIIKHIPWAHRNIPIPTDILDKVIQIFKDKFMASVYEHSNTLYCP
jgi:hypothetical protein